MTSSIEAVARSSRNQGRPFRRPAAYLPALAAICVLISPAPTGAQGLEPEALLGHVKYLASDELAGREAGEPGADSAASYIARLFESYGLEPLGTEGYRQPFQITTTIAVAGDSRLVLRAPRGTMELELLEEWVPFNFSAGGSLSGGVYDAGYGLRDEDYEGLAGHEGPKIAVLRGGVPEDFDPHGSGIDPSPRRRATAARDQGAEAVLITMSRLQPPQPGDPPHGVGIPAIQILESEEILAWLADAQLEVLLDAKLEPLRVDAYNVVGRVRGRDPALADQAVVVGAHYDHLGMGGPGSLAPDADEPHNGADDNASGTAVLLGLAEYFAANPDLRPSRSLVFVAFTAEEMGLLGSEHFVSNPPFPLENVAAMLNFDMVGRLREGKLQVFGTETAEEFPALLDSLDAADTLLTLSHIGDGYGPSDQTSFYARQIPVLHLFTGTHSDYHRPEDDWDLINAAGMAQVGEFAAALIRELGDDPDELTLVRQQRPQAAGGGGYGPYLGTIPDFGEVEGGGLRLAGVRAGGPAEQAGLQAGDIVIEFGGKEVLNIYDYTYALRDHAPGDTVAIKVRRDGEVVDVTAVLGRRQ